MRKALCLFGVVALVAAAAAYVTSSQPAEGAAVVAAAPTAANIQVPTLTPEEQQRLQRRFSPARLAAIRTRLQADAQRAMRDDAEQAFREPTAAEAAALTGAPREATSLEVPLAGGGAALRSDASSVNVVRATVGPDGAIVTHEGQGARHER